MNSREEILFEAAVDLAPEGRAARLEADCAGDPDLRRRVEALLEAYDRAGAFMTEPAVPSVEQAREAPTLLSEKPGDKIAHYKLLQQIGEGGCGVVYLAEQEEPIRRRVAVKVIKLGMDTKAVIARFEAERQALAMMDHPNIAKVFDAGATATGRPYFVMELVRGIRITDYCDQNNLSTDERLKLFIQVCHAIQHAHQKGIIHRDIKPSNILVTVNDGVPLPKVIDFGIAKATGGQVLTARTLFTAFEQFLGTPAYMSPEQAEMTSLDVDTRSDVYSLGILLYELLTGQTPLDGKTLIAVGLAEMRRIIREREPARPSTRLSTLAAEAQATVAKQRRTVSTRLIHQLRGELDWIVMKCLEKDRARRYETANALAMDLENHLAHRAVSAAAPGWLYRLAKFVRRNRAATAFVVLLLVGSAVSLWLALEATRARTVAQRREAEARENLFASYLTGVRASRLTGRPGRRFDALDLAAKGAAIHPSVELRSEAASALALVDMRIVREWTGYPTGSEQIALDSRFKHYARGNAERQISLRRVRDDRELHSWQAKTAPERFSPDDRFLAGMAWGSQPLLQVWEVDSRRLLLEEPLYASGPTPDFHPNRPVIAAGVPDGNIRFFDLETGKHWNTRSINKAPACLRFRPDGRQVAVACRRPPELQVYDTASGEPVATLTQGKDLNDLDWSPDGRWLAAPCEDGRVFVWDMSANDRPPPRVLAGHDRLASSVCFDPQGNLLLSQSWDGMVALWSWPSGNLILRGDGSLMRLSFSRDGRMAGPFVHGSTVRLLEVAQAPEYRVLPASSGRVDCNAAFSRDTRWLMVPGETGVECWGLREWKRAWIEPMTPPRFIAFSPAGERLMLSGPTGLQERRWVEGTGNTPPQLEPAHPVSSRQSGPLEFSGDGNVMVVADREGLRVHSSSGAEPLMLTMKMCNWATITPDGKWAAASAWDGAASDVVVWQLPGGREVLRLDQTQGAVQFTSDGRWLVIATETVLESRAVGTWASVARVPVEHALNLVVVSGDGRWCAVQRGIQQILLCEVPSLKPVFTLDTGPEAPVAFSPDNRFLLTRRSTGQFCLWDLRLMREELTAIGLGW